MDANAPAADFSLRIAERQQPNGLRPTKSEALDGRSGRVLALAVWQVSKWSRHLDGGFAESATGRNWPNV